MYSNGDGMFVTDAARGSSRRIAEAGSTPRWWPNDTDIFYTQADALWVVGVDGSDRRRLGTGLDTASLSPDATWIAWNGEDGGLWVMSTDGRGHTQLTPDGWRPEWAPDGSRLFATYHDLEGWPQGLVVMDMGGWVLAEITPGNVFGPVWLPDSRSVAYSADDVFIADIESAIRRLTDQDTFDAITCLVLSPAGDQLAYRTGNGVFVVNTDGTVHTRLDRYRECPTWSPGQPDRVPGSPETPNPTVTAVLLAESLKIRLTPSWPTVHEGVGGHRNAPETVCSPWIRTGPTKPNSTTTGSAQPAG